MKTIKLLKEVHPLKAAYDYSILKQFTDVTLDNPPEKPPTLLKMINDEDKFAEFFTVGDISAVVGRSGNGKSNLLCLTISEMIQNKNTDHFQTQLKEDKPIIWIDTEQSDYDVWRILEKISNKTGLSNEEIKKRIIVKKTESIPPKWRKQLLFDIINDYQPELLILDGVADIVDSINDEKEAKEVIREIRGFASKSSTHIIGVIHSSDKNNQSNEAMGWIGTVWKHKAEGQMNCSYDKKNQLFNVTFEKARHGFPKNFSFVWDKELHAPLFKPDSELSKELTDTEKNDSVIDAYAKDMDYRINFWRDVWVQVIPEYGHHSSMSKAKLKPLVQKTMLSRSGAKKFGLNKSGVLIDVALNTLVLKNVGSAEQPKILFEDTPFLSL